MLLLCVTLLVAATASRVSLEPRQVRAQSARGTSEPDDDDDVMRDRAHCNGLTRTHQVLAVPHGWTSHGPAHENDPVPLIFAMCDVFG